MADTTKIGSERVVAIDTLRGIAALAVCVFHITNGKDGYLSDSNILKILGSYGWLGVEVFFVISGFIIPYAMERGGYTILNIKPFLIKRILRIDPPYLCTILIVLLLNYLSTLLPLYAGNGFTLNLKNLLLHFGYLNGIMNEPWVSPVFWTLAIEFQFYLVTALSFGFMMHEYKVIRYLFLIVILCADLFFESQVLFFKYSSLFCVGMMAFYYHTKMIGRAEFLLSSTVLLLFCHLQLGVLPMIAGLVTLLILFVPLKLRVLEFLGMISYSLYLIHIPVGGRIINLSTNFVEQELARSFVALGAVGVSVGISYLFFRLIETPSIKLSKAIKYDRTAEIKEQVPSLERAAP